MGPDLLLALLLAWSIPSYQIEIIVRPDLSLRVHERYTVDFRGDRHHGIYREIPVFYRKGIFFQNIRVQVRRVLRNGQPEPYLTRLRGRDLFLRIGDPDRWLGDLETYDIVYTVRYGLDLKGDHAYLYFNAIGPQWSVPLEHGQVIVHLPPDTPVERAHAWLGYPGSRDHQLWPDTLAPGILLFEPREAVMPGRALTVFVEMPRRFFKEPDVLEQGVHFVVDNGFYFLPLVVLFLLLGIWYRWGRDPALRRSLVVRYDPPEDLTPGEAGILVDEKLDPRDLSATVLDLARRGYLTIRSEPVRILFFTLHRFTFRLKNPDFSGLKVHEKKLLRALFPPPRTEGQEVRSGEVKKQLREKFSGIEKAFYKAVVKAGYFPTSPDTVRGSMVAIGILWFIVSVFLMVKAWVSVAYIPGLLLSGIFIMLFSRVMPRKTPKGVREYLEVKGFEEFLRRVEQDQIRRLGRDRDLNEYFSRLMPYAVALGLEDRLLEVFDGLLTTAPTWFVTASGDPMSLEGFGQSIAGTMGSFNNLFSAPTRGGGGGGLSGGGSAGGGIGGGGGGAW